MAQDVEGLGAVCVGLCARVAWQYRGDYSLEGVGMNKEALHKLAAESLNEGLRLDEWDKIGCVNHDCDQCKAQQEPVAWMNPHGGMLTANYIENFASGLDKEIHNIPLYTSPQPAPVQGWKLVPVQPTDEMVDALADTDPEHDSVWDAVLAATPQAQPAREWVNLTVDELIDLEHKHLRHEALVQAIEAKLKEKNT